MAEAVAAAASMLSVVGIALQVFDGCVKGFVLMSTAHNLGRDADIMRSMLDWEQYRLEQWAEQVGLHDPAKADMLVDWKLVTDTLRHVENLLSDSKMLKKKYNLILTEDKPVDSQTTLVDNGQEKASASRFKRLFGHSDRNTSTAVARVIQAKNSPARKLWWAAVDKENMKHLIDDVSYLIQRLHDSLNMSVQAQMQQSIQSLLQQATDRYSNAPDLEFLRELAAQIRRQEPSGDSADAEDFEHAIEKKFRNLLFSAISDGKLDDIISLLDKGVNPDAENFCGWSTLICASEAGHLAIVEQLLQRGADHLHCTIGQRIPLHFAAEAGHPDVVELLLQQSKMDVNYRDYQGETALFKAANKGRTEVVSLLVKQKDIDVNSVSKDGFTPLLQAIYDEYKEVTALLIAQPELDPNLADRDRKQTPLWMAAGNHDDVLRSLLARDDIDVNGRGRWGETAICRTARISSNHALQFLLNAKADCNLQNDDGQTPLSCAAAEGNEVGLDLLLQRPNIKIDFSDLENRTALFRAAEAGHTKCVKALLAKGAQTEVQSKEGQTALSIASANGHKIPAKLLVKNGAIINAQDKKGNTPLALATENNHEILVRLLLENGADAELADEDEETPFEKARDKHMDDIMRLFKEVLKT
ncbi:MAG: hypothetical protein Q9164_003884 [Protoblastenia rupestris]